MKSQAETVNCMAWVQEDTRTDAELVGAINRGQASAFEALYFRYRDWVVALAYRFTGDSNGSLDVMQETFLYVLRKFPGFKLTANFKTFLYPAVRNLSIAAREKAARCQATEMEMLAAESAAAPQNTATTTDDLAVVLASLPAEQREVLLLRFVDGLKLEEIAAAMDIPAGTVKSRLHNALTSLRKDARVKEFFDR